MKWPLAVGRPGRLRSAAAPSAVDLLDVYNRALDTDPLWQQANAVRLANHETKTQAVLGLLPLDVSANKNLVGIGSVQVEDPGLRRGRACRSICSTGTAGWR